jgi:hypothetical protein
MKMTFNSINDDDYDDTFVLVLRNTPRQQTEWRYSSTLDNTIHAPATSTRLRMHSKPGGFHSLFECSAEKHLADPSNCPT